MRVRSLCCSVLGLVLIACGGAKAPTAPPAAAAERDAGGAAVVLDAGAPAERPFAASAAEAMQLISGAIDKKGDTIGRCILEYRRRKDLAHERVEISVGIDQEGHLIGVMLTKGKSDDSLSSCVMDALKTAVFPRSHSGVITMKKSYEEVVR